MASMEWNNRKEERMLVEVVNYLRNKGIKIKEAMETASGQLERMFGHKRSAGALTVHYYKVRYEDFSDVESVFPNENYTESETVDESPTVENSTENVEIVALGDDILSAIENFKNTFLGIKQKNEELEKLVDELTQNNERLAVTNNKLVSDLRSTREEYGFLLRILEQARQTIRDEELGEFTGAKFKMDNNGNLERVG